VDILWIVKGPCQTFSTGQTMINYKEHGLRSRIQKPVSTKESKSLLAEHSGIQPTIQLRACYLAKLKCYNLSFAEWHRYFRSKQFWSQKQRWKQRWKQLAGTIKLKSPESQTQHSRIICPTSRHLKWTGYSANYCQLKSSGSGAKIPQNFNVTIDLRRWLSCVASYLPPCVHFWHHLYVLISSSHN